MDGTSPKFLEGDDMRQIVRFLGERVERYLNRVEAIGAPPPNLTEPFPDPIKDDGALMAKLEIMRACERIMALVLGPVEWMMFQCMTFVDPACVAAMIELGIHEAITPGPEPTSLDELVQKTGASKDILRKFSGTFKSSPNLVGAFSENHASLHTAALLRRSLAWEIHPQRSFSSISRSSDIFSHPSLVVTNVIGTETAADQSFQL